MPETVRWQRGRARLPPETDRAAEAAVPHPAHVPGQARDCFAIRQFDGRTARLAIHQVFDEVCRLGFDARELFLPRFRSPVIRRPAQTQRFRVSRQVLQ
jgi:hypothetical protein